MVSGALQSAIHDHGPITTSNLNSATKRVVAQLRGAAESILAPEGTVLENTALESAHKRYQKLRHGHDELLRRHATLSRRITDARALHPKDFERLDAKCTTCKVSWPCPTIEALARETGDRVGEPAPGDDPELHRNGGRRPVRDPAGGR